MRRTMHRTMHRTMRRVVVTPAGRRRYLAILYTHLKAQKKDFDLWEVWINTWDQKDIDFCRMLAETEAWIVCVTNPHVIQGHGNRNIHHFFTECRDDSVYLRLDDDIVYLDRTFVGAMFDYRLAHPEFYLVYANIINNAVISSYHQRRGRVVYDRVVSPHCMDEVGWKDPVFAETLHRAFLAAPHPEQWHLPECIPIDANQRISINAISWIGSPGPVGIDEEQWLSVDHPLATNTRNCIFGKAVCVHFAFCTQRDHLERPGSALLDAYAAMTR